MKKKYINYLKILITIAIVGIFAFNVFQFDGSRSSTLCEAMIEAKELAFEGLLLYKYRDTTHHMYKTIVISTKEGELKSRVLVLDHSGFYEIIQKGDSIKKEGGSLSFIVTRNQRSFSHRLDYQCDTTSIN